MPTAEVWRPLKIFEGYEVSDRGRVRSWRLGGSTRLRETPIFLTPRMDNGLYSVFLYVRGGRHRTLSVGKLVLTAFFRAPYANEIVRYDDSNPANCTLSNLYYQDRAEAAKEGYAAGKWATPVYKLSDAVKAKIVQRVTSGKITKSEASREYRLHRSTINRLISDANV